MNRRKDLALTLGGLAIGLALGAPVAAAALTASPSTQRFYLNGQPLALEAYAINGNNYVKLRDIGKAVDFGVEYDAATNSVYVETDAPYTEALPRPAASGTPSPADVPGTVTLPSDGSQYIPKAGDIIACDDGSLYTITDLSRYNANYFASGPLGPLPKAVCDWSQLDQPPLPEPEARHFTVEGKEYLFVRNLYETRRMLYTLYNAMGANSKTWANGAAVLRSDGTPWVHVQLSIPREESVSGFWPWREEEVIRFLNACPAGTISLEVWDVYKDGVFQRTEYKIC